MRILLFSLTFAILATTVLYAFFPDQAMMPWSMVFSLCGITACGLGAFRKLLFPSTEDLMHQLMEDNRDALAQIEQEGGATCSEQAGAVLAEFKQLVRESEYRLRILVTVPPEKRHWAIRDIMDIAQSAYQRRRCYDQLIGLSANTR